MKYFILIVIAIAFFSLMGTVLTTCPQQNIKSDPSALDVLKIYPKLTKINDLSYEISLSPEDFEGNTVPKRIVFKSLNANIEEITQLPSNNVEKPSGDSAIWRIHITEQKIKSTFVIKFVEPSTNPVVVVFYYKRQL